MEKVEFILATRNPGKVVEIQEILKEFPFLFLSLDDIDFQEEIIEDKVTFLENALKKTKTVAGLTGKMCLADDSGLEVDALKGQPGVLSARFAGENADSQANNEKLLNLLKDIPESERTARFSCVMALALGEKLIGTAEGYCYGKIAFEEKGTGGFGYDPIFIPKGYDQTFAEIGNEVKNKISHRARALQNLKGLIKANLDIIEES